MSRRRPASPDPATPAVLPLTVSDLRFIDAYLKSNGNGTRAYLDTHPDVKYTSAEACASRLLSSAKVQAELARRVQVDGGVTKAFIESELLWALNGAHAKDDYVAGASIAMDCARLAGFLVEKREIKTVTDDQRSALRDLVQSAMRTLSPATTAKEIADEAIKCTQDNKSAGALDVRAS